MASGETPQGSLTSVLGQERNCPVLYPPRYSLTRSCHVPLTFKNHETVLKMTYFCKPKEHELNWMKGSGAFRPNQED